MCAETGLHLSTLKEILLALVTAGLIVRKRTGRSTIGNEAAIRAAGAAGEMTVDDLQDFCNELRATPDIRSRRGDAMRTLYDAKACVHVPNADATAAKLVKMRTERRRLQEHQPSPEELHRAEAAKQASAEHTAEALGFVRGADGQWKKSGGDGG